MPISVAIVEDNAGICEELKQILAEDPGCVCVCVCRNLQTALREIPPLAPDVIIMDVRLPDGSGIDGTARLKRLLPRSEIMIYTVYEESDEIFRALEAGASGYLLKETAPEEILRSIHEIRHGGVPMNGEVARKVIQSFRRQPQRVETLTEREEEILRLLAQGHVTKEIAGQLSISAETVKSHLKHIYGKLHVRSRTEAVIKYMQ
jgi:DNA-binding NarL/FixJ family response regulator